MQCNPQQEWRFLRQHVGPIRGLDRTNIRREETLSGRSSWAFVLIRKRYPVSDKDVGEEYMHMRCIRPIRFCCCRSTTILDVFSLFEKYRFQKQEYEASGLWGWK